ncbi:hypothetical protein GCM10017786_57840 [Amycolatopsis deserti]|uniref:Uncharacterized protein n=1 Tax=Amycolatopsis deserti TaxID=185696 RepID=A0ABQ3JBY1_9PSEU|nr:hypothetical protein [Amycolatopsis deserti]GHF16391.1 hypothetical protein GCM10017786_57840 [Amycolatopsis deserti]
MKVTAGDLKALLRAGNGAQLVMQEGALAVLPAEELPRHEGALTVIEREALRQRVGEEPDDRSLDEQAAILSTEIDTLGA